MKRLGILVVAGVLAGLRISFAGQIDLSNGGSNWPSVTPGTDLPISVYLWSAVGDPPKNSADLELLITGSGVLPTVKSIDFLVPGAVFEGGTQHPDPAWGLGTSNVYRAVDLNGGTTTREGLLAQVLIDTTGASLGTYTVSAVRLGEGNWSGTTVLDEDFNEIPLTLISGTFSVVPEPATMVLLVSGVFSLAGIAWYRASRTRRLGNRTEMIYPQG